MITLNTTIFCWIIWFIFVLTAGVAMLEGWNKNESAKFVTGIILLVAMIIPLVM